MTIIYTFKIFSIPLNLPHLTMIPGSLDKLYEIAKKLMSVRIIVL